MDDKRPRLRRNPTATVLAVCLILCSVGFAVCTLVRESSRQRLEAELDATRTKLEGAEQEAQRDHERAIQAELVAVAASRRAIEANQRLIDAAEQERAERSKAVAAEKRAMEQVMTAERAIRVTQERVAELERLLKQKDGK